MNRLSFIKTIWPLIVWINNRTYTKYEGLKYNCVCTYKALKYITEKTAEKTSKKM